MVRGIPGRRLWFKPCHIRVTENGADQSRLRFPWRRDRDLNPGRHHCLTRFRIVRVQPLRHLCTDGRRAPEMQTSFYRKSAKKATDFAPSREIFCCEGAILASRVGARQLLSPCLPLREPRRGNDNSLASPVQGEVVCRRQSGGVVEEAQRRPYNPPASLRSAPSLTQGGLK